MINKIEIDGFKNLSDVKLQLPSLTVITGKNSTGKSSLLQAILFCQKVGEISKEYEVFINLDFESVRNKYKNSKQIDICLECDGNRAVYRITKDEKKSENENVIPVVEKSLYYLSANRAGAEDVVSINPALVSGPTGSALLGTFEQEKSKQIDMDFVKDRSSYTLSAQVNYWMTYIIGTKLELHSEKRSSNRVEIKYKSDDIPDILPSQLGAGVSYLVKILILCLRSKPGDVIMIENPEIHLYPGAKSRLTEFLSFIASNNRQVILETHSDIIVTKVRHEVFKKRLNHENVLILYKDKINSQFDAIKLDVNGRFSIDFPESFFDATLSELLEME